MQMDEGGSYNFCCIDFWNREKITIVTEIDKKKQIKRDFYPI